MNSPYNTADAYASARGDRLLEANLRGPKEMKHLIRPGAWVEVKMEQGTPWKARVESYAGHDEYWIHTEGKRFKVNAKNLKVLK